MGEARIESSQKDNHEPASAERSAAQTVTPSPARSHYPPHGLSLAGASSPDDIPLTRDNLLFLQRTVGNRAVARLLQRKMKISRPGDAHEREADRVADQVVQMPAPSLSRKATSATEQSAVKIGRVGTSQGDEMRRQSGDEDEKRGEGDLIRAKEEAGQTPARAPDIESQINHAQGGGGEPLTESARAYYEPRFGQDFSDVRIHRGAQAAGAAQAINARAYTTGRDIVFGAGEYAPGTTEGKHLLAHELTHVVQQEGSAASPGQKSRSGIENIEQRPDISGMVQRDEGTSNGAGVADAVIAELNRPDPIAGVGNPSAAIALLEPLSMTELLGVLADLNARGYLLMIEGSVDLASPTAQPRLRVGVTLVEVASGASAALPSDRAMNALTGMTEADRNTALSFFSLRATNPTIVEGLQALTGSSEETPATAGSLTPLPWGPPGGQPIPFYIGNQAHIGIAASYIAAHFGQEVFTNFIPISTILGRAAQFGMINNPAAASAAQLALRPDIANLTLRHLYEIKPLNSAAQAAAEAAAYVAVFIAVGLPITLGPQGEPGTSGTIPAPAGFYVFSTPAPGVIVYQYSRLPPVRVPAPERSPSTQTDQDYMKKMETLTGLTGAALIIYVIISEGSRFALPPRNLVPVP